MLMESIGQDECLWFAPIQLFDSILLSPISRKNEEILKKSLIDGSEQMLNSFNQFPSSTILINLTRIFNVVLDLPDQITSNPSPLLLLLLYLISLQKIQQHHRPIRI